MRPIVSILVFLLVVLSISIPKNVALSALAPPPPVLILPLKVYAPKKDAEKLRLLREKLALYLKKERLPVLPLEKIKERVGELPPVITDKQALELCQKYHLGAVIWGTITEFGGSISVDLRLTDCAEGLVKRLYTVGHMEEWPMLSVKVGKRLLRSLLAREVVAEIHIKGNVRMDEEAILRAVKLKPGDIFDPKVLREDLKSIYKLGYFDDVRADLEETPQGLVVTYIVREKPVVKRIVYEGNKAIKEGDLQKVSELKPYTILNLNKVNEAAERIELLYKERGYYNTKVNPEVKSVSPTEVKVVFHIKEGEKVYIKKIAFEGNHAFSDEELKGLLEISEKSPISWVKKIKTYITGGGIEPGVYSYGGLYRDLGKIISFYQNHGYIDVKVGEPKVRQEGRWIYITIPVEEGPQYHIRRVDIIQDLFKHKEYLLKKLEIRKKDVFDREVLRRDIMKLTDIFADKGYAYAKVEPEIKKDEKKHTVDIILKVDKGPLVYVNRIEINGNTKTRDKVIRRELLIVEQRPFSATRLRRSQDRVRRLGYFDDVNVATEKGVREDQMDVKIKVKERPTGQFSIGTGYSSVDKLILMGQISQNNLFGKGQVLSFQGIIGARTTRYSVTFVEPYFRDSRLSLTTNLYNWEREYDDYTRDSKGGGVRFGYLLTPNTRVYFGYRYDDSDLSDYSYYTSPIILESKDIHITSALEFGLRRDTRNHFFDPTRGTTLSISFEHAGGLLGGDAAFEKISVTGGIYFPTFWEITGHIRGGWGYVTEGHNGKLPVYEKFYLGGIDSVRGYQYADISPKDPDTGDRIGGEHMFFIQNEAIFPIVKSMGLKGVVFFDIGNVWGKYQSWDVNDIRQSVGLGIRWLSPMGPLRIEWGYNINARSDEDKSNFNFRIGGQF